MGGFYLYTRIRVGLFMSWWYSGAVSICTISPPSATSLRRRAFTSAAVARLGTSLGASRVRSLSSSPADRSALDIRQSSNWGNTIRTRLTPNCYRQMTPASDPKQWKILVRLCINVFMYLYIRIMYIFINLYIYYFIHLLTY